MKSRWFICVFILAAYSVSLAHSVLPHHHYASLADYKNREAANEPQHDHDADHKTGDTGEELPGSLFFLTHLSNVDFALSKLSFDQKFKIKVQWPAIQIEDISIGDTYFTEPLFHIPDSPPWVDNPILSCRSLRAPPSVI